MSDQHDDHPGPGGPAPMRFGGRGLWVAAAVVVVVALVAAGAAFLLSGNGDGGGGGAEEVRRGYGPSIAGQGAAAPVPETCRPPATNSGAQVRDGFPDDATTGPEVAGLDEDNLPASGQPSTWEITEAGTVVDGVFHHGRIVVAAADVTIENSVVCGTGALIIQNESTNLLVRNSIVLGETGTAMTRSEAQEPCSASVGYGDYTMEASEALNCADGLKVAESVTVRDSYFHDQYTFRGGPSGEPGQGTHNDTVQYQSETPLTHFVFEGNSAYQDPCTSNRHFQMAPQPENSGSGGTWRIEDNFFYGIKLLNVARGVQVEDGMFSDNTIAGAADRGPFGQPLYANGDLGGVEVSGNRYEDGSAADTNYDGDYECSEVG